MATRRKRPHLRGALLGLMALGLVACGDAPPSSRSVAFTWLGVTHWRVETPIGSLLLDAYTSRPPLSATGPTNAGLELFRRIEFAARPPLPVRWIVVGHSHFDHAIDVGPIARETGATVIGSRTTCLIAEGQGLPTERCLAVGGGETIALDPRLELRVVRVPHSAPDTIGRFAELAEPPRSAATAPNGGNLGFLFRLRGGPTWFYSNSIAPIDAVDGSGVDFVAALSATLSAGSGAALPDPPDLWLGAPFGGVATLGAYLDIVRPRAFVPHHWDGVAPDITLGVTQPFAPGGLAADLAARAAELVVPTQYFDKVVLDASGTSVDPNAEVKQAFGLR